MSSDLAALLAAHPAPKGWALAWYLAAELTARFGPRLGLRALPLHREYFGWYGIQLDLPDGEGRVHPLGRLAAAGDPERWDDAEHHRLPLADRAETDPPEALLSTAIVHLDLLSRRPLPRPASPDHALIIEVLARLALGRPRHRFGIYPAEGYGGADLPRLPTYVLNGPGGRVSLDGGGLVQLDDSGLDLPALHRAGATPSTLAAQLADALGLHAPAVPAAPSDYTLAEHRHRFAVWCAARAASRRLKGGSNAALRRAIEASSLPALVTGPPERLPRSAPEFRVAHRGWCFEILAALRDAGIEASFGRAAKLVAIYLKTMVLCGDGAETPFGALIHPPIDRVLLQALARDERFPKGLRAEWRTTTWTTLNVDLYDYLIVSLVEAGLDFQGFWRAERWWVGDG